MFWLYLLGLVTVLAIALRRVKRRQAPLDNELYAKKVAVEHVQSGIAWVRVDGRIGSANQSFAKAFRYHAEQLTDQLWLSLLAENDRERARQAYSQMLLAGIDSFDCQGLRADGGTAWLNVRLVAGHDQNMQFAGHHCLIEDRTREHELEQRILQLEQAIAEETATRESTARESLPEVARRLRKSPGAARA